MLDSGDMIADGPTRDSLRIFREHLLDDAVEHDHAHLLGTVHIESVSTPSGSFEVKSGAGLHFDVQCRLPKRLQRKLRDGALHPQRDCS